MKHKKLFIVSFSILILVGLCIGVFADSYNDSMVGSYYYNTPYNCGSSLVVLANNDSYNLSAGYYYLKVNCTTNDSYLIESNNDYIVQYYGGNHTLYYKPTIQSNMSYYDYLSLVSDSPEVYIYINATYDVTITYTGGENMIVYSIKETNIDVYNNSNDVWTNVVSTITEGTNTILDNDILLLFAAALPLVSFGAGMLIRLFRKS